MKATIPGFIHYSPPSFSGGDPWFAFLRFDASAQGYVTVMPHTIEVELPADFNPVSAQVQALEAAKEEALRQYQENVKRINEQLSKLQALEYAA